MKPYIITTFALMIILACLSLSGCQHLRWWDKKDAKIEPSQTTVMTNDKDVMAFNDFRTIDASMNRPSDKPEKNKSLLWDNTEARDIERRLGVTD